VGIFGSSRSFIGSLSFFFVSRKDVALAVARRQYGVEVEDEGNLKDLDVIFVFIEAFCVVRCFF
jgi:hypothetical protein